MLEAIIIGEDHANTLSLIRNLGRSNISFYAILHSENRHLCAHSRYIKKNYSFVDNTEKAIVDKLHKIKNKINNKPVLLCATDLAQFAVDANFKELEQSFICFNFNNEPGKICRLMDKYEQYLFAKENNIEMAYSCRVRLDEYGLLLEDMKFPVIVKPLISAFGQKSDIETAHNKGELSVILDKLKGKDYSEVIIQEYINKVFEVTTLGCIFDDKTEPVVLCLKKIHMYPKKGGSTSFAKNIVEVPKDIINVIDKLKIAGYTGFYDIEFFYVDGKYILNEINFRNSGVNYALDAHKINMPLQWIMFNKGENIQKYDKQAKKSKFNFTLYMELLLLKEKDISLVELIRAFCKASAYSMFSWDDMKPFFSIIFNVDLIRKKMKK